MTIGVVISLILLALKLAGFIDWSWWTVALPAIVESLIAGLVMLWILSKKGGRK